MEKVDDVYKLKFRADKFSEIRIVEDDHFTTERKEYLYLKFGIMPAKTGNTDYMAGLFYKTSAKYQQKDSKDNVQKKRAVSM